MFKDIVSTRHSVRAFTGESVPREHLAAMITAANQAPSGGNRRPWRFVVVSDKDLLNRIRTAIISGMDALPSVMKDLDPRSVSNMQQRYRHFSLFFADAPITVFVGYDTSCSVLAKILESRGMPPAEAEREAGFVEVQGTAAAVENFLLMAHALGYGACWMDPPFFARDAITRLIGITPPLRLLVMIPVGKSAEKTRHVDRKDISKIVRFIP